MHGCQVRSSKLRRTVPIKRVLSFQIRQLAQVSRVMNVKLRTWNLHDRHRNRLPMDLSMTASETELALAAVASGSAWASETVL